MNEEPKLKAANEQSKKFLFTCRLVGNKEICPIVPCKACLDMNIIQYNDNDSPNKPQAKIQLCSW